MTRANFKFISEAVGGSQFTVVSFSASEAISALYQYDIEVKAPLATAINLDDVLDNPAHFVTELEGVEYPVFGVLSQIREIKTVQGYVYYQAVLVPRLWWLSIYKTNEIYTFEKTIDQIIQQVLENAGFSSGTDFDLGLLDTGDLIEREYRCQFGESDFDFISRLIENEGIFYYFDHSGDVEKIIFLNNLSSVKIDHPELIYDVSHQSTREYDTIHGWSCCKQRLPASVTVRDYNPDQPSLDVYGAATIDQMGQGAEYIYGANVGETEDAAYLSRIRAEEYLCHKTRYYGESNVPRLQAGYIFGLDLHPNQDYNNVEYLTLEVSHEGQSLDMTVSSSRANRTDSTPQYRNSFVAIEASEQFRPSRATPKPRFYGTMTAFIYAEGGDDNTAQVDAQGRYRVHLPFDRADGTKNSDDPDRKASAWIRMVQPYVGHSQGMYFPMKGGAEVLLTFINGDPDQPVISGGLPNASEPSLLNSDNNFIQVVSTDTQETVTGTTINISGLSAGLDDLAKNDLVVGTKHINANLTEASVREEKTIDTSGRLSTTMSPNDSMLPPWSTAATGGYNQSLIAFKNYTDVTFEGPTASTAPSMSDADWKDDTNNINIDRGCGDNYVYANARTFAYPQHERVYFIGTFHEDFHVKDDFLNKSESWTGEVEQFHFPAPGGDATQTESSTEGEINPTGVRGVSEDKRWGDQMTYAWGRVFNWGGGPELGNGNAGGAYNYGNAYTENLLEVSGYTLSEVLSRGNTAHITDAVTQAKFEEYKEHKNDWDSFTITPRGTTPLKDCKTLDPNTSSVEKTFGNTYSYQMGYAVEIHEGNSNSKTYGDTWEETYGTTDSTYHGEIHEYTMAGKAEFNLAACSAISLAESFELYGGAKQEINLAWAGEFFLGSTLDSYLALKQEIGLAIVFELFFAPKFGVGLGPEIKSVKPLKLEAEDAEIKSLKLDLHETGVMLGRAQCHIGQVQLAVENAGIEVHG